MALMVGSEGLTFGSIESIPQVALPRVPRLVFQLLFALSIVAGCSDPSPFPPEEGGPHRVDVRRNLRIHMPEGVRLAADLYRPRGLSGPLPTILIRLPYDRRWYTPATTPAHFFASWGFAVLVQDVRGRFGSEGVYSLTMNDGVDGRSTLDWIADQPWSNGRVGTFGCSNLGENQLYLAAERHPAHLAMVPQGAGGAVGTLGGMNAPFGAIEGGAVSLSSLIGWYLAWGGSGSPQQQSTIDERELAWSLPLVSMMSRAGVDDSEWRPFFTLPPGSTRWDELGYLSDSDQFDLPALYVDTWFDPSVSGTLALAEGGASNSQVAPSSAHRYTVIGPWGHCEIESGRSEGWLGELWVEGAGFHYWQLYRDWFNYWLKGPDAGELPTANYTFFVLGENRWRTSESWPPPWTEEEVWYLSIPDTSGSEEGSGSAGVLQLGQLETSGEVAYLYDPADPVPSRGGTVCCTGVAEDVPGAFDVSNLDSRSDILRFVSPPLEEPRLLAGPITVVMEVASSAPDTDFTVRLIDLSPSGQALAIREGILRMRYREDGLVPAEPMIPDEWYEIRIPLGDLAYRIPAGHRLRLDVSSSNFPRWDRNLNTTDPAGEGTTWQVAVNRVRSTPLRASRLILRRAENAGIEP